MIESAGVEGFRLMLRMFLQQAESTIRERLRRGFRGSQAVADAQQIHHKEWAICERYLAWADMVVQKGKGEGKKRLEEASTIHEIWERTRRNPLEVLDD